MHRQAISRTSGEHGFTLVELLVVILIIGVLAAIAIPSFLNQKGKSTDASAKELARTAETTAESYATDHESSFKGVEAKVLKEYEPSLQIKEGSNNAWLSTAEAVEGNAGYKVTATATSGDTFTITHKATGTIERTCSGTKGGCINSSW